MPAPSPPMNPRGDAERIAHVLIVDDDPEIGALLAQYLGQAGLATEVAAEGAAMWAAMGRRRFDVVVLDLMLPGDDGLALCQQLRQRSQVPVIMLTARGRPMDRIIGLETGADDYMAKPFDPRELLARLRSLLRRSGMAVDPPPLHLRFAGHHLDTRERALQLADGRVVVLGDSEFQVLLLLLQHPDQVVERDFLAEQVYGRDRLPTDRAIDMCISRLRTLVEGDTRLPRVIRTVRHRGYSLAGPVHGDG